MEKLKIMLNGHRKRLNWESERVGLLFGNCVSVMQDLELDSFDAVITDPPYHIGFMGKDWEQGNIAFQPKTWKRVFKVMKPGSHLLAFGGTRTFHRLVCAIEDAGFEIRDTIAWMYGSGFPKSLDFAGWRDAQGTRHIKDEFAGHPQAEGFGTALKPAIELICVARKPLSELTVAANVLKHGTGGLNIDACRVASESRPIMIRTDTIVKATSMSGSSTGSTSSGEFSQLGRWPANVAHDGSDEVLAAFARFGESKSIASKGRNGKDVGSVFSFARTDDQLRGHSDTGTAARFFYTAKAPRKERQGNHPTVKPQKLMRWLIKLVCPIGGRVLDPFAGTGSTLVACDWLGIDSVGIELESETFSNAKLKIKRMREDRLV
jgi:site-specific DNA-methyltransferase (adenine-specific)